MFLIVTYGSKGLKGVQVKGLRIASSFKKDEVTFLNYGESEWLSRSGFPVVEHFIEGFLTPQYIAKHIFDTIKPSTLIFCDIPTNRFSQMAILMEAQRRQIPTIIVDNYYSYKQLSEKPFTIAYKLADLLLLNGLSYAKKVETEKLKIIPPLLTKPTDQARNHWRERFNVREGEQLLTLLNYNDKTSRIINDLIENLQKKHSLKFVLLGSEKQPDLARLPHVFPLPFLQLDDVSAIFSLSDVIIGKMGYLQFLESAALEKIFVSVGGDKGFRKFWLDKELQEVFFHFDDYGASLVQFLDKVLSQPQSRKEIAAKLGTLNDKKFFNPDEIKSLLTSVRFTPKQLTKSVLLYVDRGDDKNEVKLVKDIMKHEEFIFPFIFHKPVKAVDERKFSEFDTWNEEDILGSSFGLIASISSHSFHGFATIAPWHLDLLNALDNLITSADKVFAVGRWTRWYFHELLRTIPAEKLKLY